jgi:SAM-dependent methyltransferase
MNNEDNAMMKKSRIALIALVALVSLAAPALLDAQDLPWEPYLGWDVPYVPTPNEVVAEMLRLAEIKPGDLLYDLGCGDGRIVIAAAKVYGIRAVGIDIDPVRIGESEAKAAEAGLLDKVRFINEDLFKSDFRDASVITMYLLNSVNLRLRPRLLAELRPGTRLVSHRFGMDDWRPDRSVLVPHAGGEPRQVHYWVVPANASGRWEWELDTGGGRRTYVFNADQRFQELRGTVAADGRELPLYDGKLEGVIIRFRLEEARNERPTVWVYEGRVQGDSIRGAARRADAPEAEQLTWSAVRDPRTVKPLDAAPTER